MLRENKKIKILVTGADGFIGSHLVETLVYLGYSVKAFVMYNSFNSSGWLDELSADTKSKLEIFSGDIRDPYGTREAMKGCDVVMHLAALIAIPYSYHSPETYVDTNIKGTLNILQAAKELGVSKILITSTSEVYGSACFVPITEEHPLRGQSPYAATKIAADQLAYSFYASFGLPVVIVRPFNTYGPRQSARAIIPTVITQIANGKKIIKLGSVYPTRDFNYVDDTVSGFVAAMQADGIFGETINIGSNFEISVGDIVNLIANIMGKKIEIQADKNRIRPKNSEVDRLLADNSKAMKLLNWQPKYEGLKGVKSGILNTVEWFSNPCNLKRYKSDVYNL